MCDPLVECDSVYNTLELKHLVPVENILDNVLR